MLDDVRRLLANDGLADVPVYATSARHGDGIAELRAEIARRVADKKVDPAAPRGRPARGGGAAQRGVRDRQAALARQAAGRGDARTPSPTPRACRPWSRPSSGQPGCGPARPPAGRSSRGSRRLRPDPLKRLHLDLGAAGKQLTSRSRTSVPEATPVQRARVDSEVRELADDVVGGHDAAVGRRRAARLAVPARPSCRPARPGHRETDLGVARLPVWADVVRVLQWLLILTALVGGVWSARRMAASGTLGVVVGPDVRRRLPADAHAARRGRRAGVLLALLCRVLVVGDRQVAGARGRTGGCGTAVARGVDRAGGQRRSRPSWTPSAPCATGLSRPR